MCASNTNYLQGGCVLSHHGNAVDDVMDEGWGEVFQPQKLAERHGDKLLREEGSE